MSLDSPRHGTVSGYRHDRCRCDRCCDANTRAVKDWRRRVGPIPRYVHLPEPDDAIWAAECDEFGCHDTGGDDR
jgi:hypothetical protein